MNDVIEVDVDELEKLVSAGAVLSAVLEGHGRYFVLRATTRGGPVVIAAARGNLRRFVHANTALALVNRLGINDVTVSHLSRWTPEQREIRAM